MSGGIFHIGADGELVEMRERAYESEEFLQALLARHPNLLAGDQVDSDSPRRWLMICREASVPKEEGGAGRWSLDHLLLDQDAVPTLVEVKRGTDTRIRREVVGQMLDYAANAVVYWPVESIRAMFEANCEREGRDCAEVLADFLDEDTHEADFWQRADTNLKAGRVRMVFVADEIPQELRRIVEFLNGQMNPAEVLALELRQYEGSGRRTLVPRIVGLTAEAERKKNSRRTRSSGTVWDREVLLSHLREAHGDAAAEAAREIVDFLDARGLRSESTRSSAGSLVYFVTSNGLQRRVVRLRAGGRVEFNFGEYAKSEAFASDSARRELARRLDKTGGGLEHSTEKIDHYHYLSLQRIASQGSARQVAELIAEIASALSKGQIDPEPLT